MTVLDEQEEEVRVSNHVGKRHKKTKKQTTRGKYNYRFKHNLCNLFVCL